MIDSIITLNNYFLVGFVGCGKTTIGSHLAKITGLNFIDLDEMIFQQQQKPIPVLFQEMGEEKFRLLETSIMQQMVQNNGQVVSMGAGSITALPIRELMIKHGISIFLDLPLNDLFERIQNSDKRLFFHLPTDESAVEDEILFRRIKALYEIRRPYYLGADITIQVENTMNANQIVEQVIYAVQKLSSFHSG